MYNFRLTLQSQRANTSQSFIPKATLASPALRHFQDHLGRRNRDLNLAQKEEPRFDKTGIYQYRSQERLQRNQPVIANKRSLERYGRIVKNDDFAAAQLMRKYRNMDAQHSRQQFTVLNSTRQGYCAKGGCQWASQESSPKKYQTFHRPESKTREQSKQPRECKTVQQIMRKYCSQEASPAPKEKPVVNTDIRNYLEGNKQYHTPAQKVQLSTMTGRFKELLRKKKELESKAEELLNPSQPRKISQSLPVKEVPHTPFKGKINYKAAIVTKYETEGSVASGDDESLRMTVLRYQHDSTKADDQRGGLTSSRVSKFLQSSIQLDSKAGESMLNNF